MNRMKFARLFLFFSLTLALRPALSQVAAKKANATPIRYSRDIPKSVLKLMPRGAKSLFWGTFSPKTGSALMAIHSFQLQPREDLGDNSSKRWIYCVYLDVFELRGRRWTRINSIQQTAKGEKLPSHVDLTEWTRDAKFYWVDSIKQTIPLLVFYDFVRWDYGPIGTKSYLSFAKGWSGKDTVQTLTEGNSNTGGDNSSVLQGDAEHIFISTTNFFGPNQIETFEFKWNGQKFEISPDEEKKLAEKERKMGGNYGRKFDEWRR